MKFNSLLNIFLLLLPIGSLHPCFASRVDFNGTLVEDACSVYPGDESLEVNFGTIVDKYLYSYNRTLGEKFTIRLIDCDLSLGTEIRVKFTGIEDAELPGLLTLDSSSSIDGIAIGLETSNGSPLAINQTIYKQNLISENNELNFQAYVRGTPLALSKHSIGRGEFFATATFHLEYE